MKAVFSDCGRYRYRLERFCEGSGTTALIMVNPSTADAWFDDATIRKVRGFGNRNQWGTVAVANLFAYKATKVEDLRKVEDPVGPDNDAHLRDLFLEADQVIYAWGPLAKQPKEFRDRWKDVHEAARRCGHEPMAIGTPCQSGHPRHPLFLAYDSPLYKWEMPHD